MAGTKQGWFMRAMGLAVSCLALAVCGCRLAALPWLMWGEEPKQDKPAEYPHLGGKTVAILVWADMNTRFEYPHVQLEVSSFVEQAMQAVPGVRVVPPRQVVDLQNRDPDWDRTPPAKLAARVGADRAVLIELTQYTTREPDSPHLFRGYISANVKVYDASQPDAGETRTMTVSVVYPPDGPGAWGSDDAFRRATMELFAEEVAGKFYDRKVKAR